MSTTNTPSPISVGIGANAKVLGERYEYLARLFRQHAAEEKRGSGVLHGYYP